MSVDAGSRLFRFVFACLSGLILAPSSSLSLIICFRISCVSLRAGKAFADMMLGCLVCIVYGLLLCCYVCYIIYL